MSKLYKVFSFFLLPYLLLVISVVIQQQIYFSAIILICLITLVFTFLTRNQDSKNLIYISAFCSMGEMTISITSLVLGAIIICINIIFYIGLTKHFIGQGGKLGTIAFLSSSLVYLIGKLL